MAGSILLPSTQFRSPTSVPKMTELRFEVFRFLLPFDWQVPCEVSIRRIFVEPDTRWTPMGGGEIPAPLTRQPRGMVRLSNRWWDVQSNTVDREVFVADALALMDATAGSGPQDEAPGLPTLVAQLSYVLNEVGSKDPGTAIAAIVDFVLQTPSRTGFNTGGAPIELAHGEHLVGRIDMPLSPTWISFYAITKHPVR